MFDIDDTLVDFSAAARAALLDVTAAHLHPGPSADAVVDAWTAVNETQYRRYTSGELDFDAMRLARMRAFLAELGHRGGDDRLLANLETARNARIFDHYQLFPDVRPALGRLAAGGWAVGVLSNSDGDYQRRKLATVGLGGHFAAEVFSGDVGVAKPDPRIFQEAVAAIHGTAARTVYVGDRWVDDVLGARGAGLPAVWLDRHAAPGPSGPITDQRIRRITGLDALDAALESVLPGDGPSAAPSAPALGPPPC